MRIVTDPRQAALFGEEEEIEVGGSAPTSETPVDQGWGLGDGGWEGVGRAAGQRVLSGLAHIAATSTSDPEASNYSRRVGRESAISAEQEEAKLGTAGRFAAGGAQYAPAIAAGMVNPFLGAGIASGMSYGDILSEQEKTTGKYDTRAAKLGAAATGAIDLASGGLGSRVGSMVRRPIQKAATAFMEDATSSAGSQVATNLAIGKDWNEGVGEATLGGAAFGAGLRGMNKAAGFAINKGGKKAIQDSQQVQRDHSVNLNQDFADNVTEYSNGAEAFKDLARTAQTPEARAEAVDAFTNLSAKNAGDAAKMNAYLLATNRGVGLTDASLNYNYTPDLGRSGPTKFAGSNFNLSQADINKIAMIKHDARPSVFRNQKAKVAGETKESFLKNVKDVGMVVLNDVKGTFSDNVTTINKRFDELNAQRKLNPWGVSKETLNSYAELRSTLSSLDSDMKAQLKGEDKSSSIEYGSNKAMKLALELGELDNLKGFDGTPGSFNPIMDVMTAQHLDNMFKAEYPAFHKGVPDPSKEAAGRQVSPIERAAIATSIFVTGGSALPLVMARGAAKGLSEAVSAQRSQTKLRKAKQAPIKRAKALAEFAKNIQKPTVKESAVDDAIKMGDGEVAARASESALADEGIIVPKSTEAPIVQRDVVDNARLWREAGIARKPAQPTPPVTPEPIVEAPVTAPVEPKVSPTVMAKPRKETRAERRRREREERKQQQVSPETEKAIEKLVETKRPVDLEAAKKVRKPVVIKDEEVVADIEVPAVREVDQTLTRRGIKPIAEEPTPLVEEPVTPVTEETPVVPKPEPDQRLTSKAEKPVKEEVVEEKSFEEEAEEELRKIFVEEDVSKLAQEGLARLDAKEAAKKDVDLEMAKGKPAAPVKAVEDTPTAVVEEVVDTTVPKREPDVKMATRKPKAPEKVEEVTQEVEPAPTPAKPEPDQRLARAAVKPAKADEVKVEEVAPAKVEDVVEEAVEAPKRDFVNLVTKPTRARIEELEAMPAKSNKLSTELGALRAKEKAVSRVLEDVAREEKVDAQTVARHIHDAGGVEAMGEKYKAVIKESIQKEKAEKAKAAGEKVKTFSERLEETAKARKEEEAAAKAEVAKQEAARKKAEKDLAAAKAEEERARATLGFATMKEARKTLQEASGNSDNPDVQKIIENATREVTGTDKGPSITQMRSTINRILETLEKAKQQELEAAKAEKSRYEAWLEKGQSDFTVDEAAYKAKKDQLQKRLKANIEATKKQKGPQSIINKEVERIQKEHNSEVKRLDAWLRRGSQDRIVQEAEFKELAAKHREALAQAEAAIEATKKKSETLDTGEKKLVEALENKSTAEKAVKEAQKAPEVEAKPVVEEEIKAAEKAVQEEFKDSTEEELKAVAKHYSDEYMKSDLPVEELARASGVMKGLSEATSDSKVKAVTTALSNLFEEAAKRKESAPDYPETWITSDMFNKVKAERFGDVDSSWVGSLSQNLTRAILGVGKKPSELKTESQVSEILSEVKRLAERSPEEIAKEGALSKVKKAVAARQRTKGIAPVNSKQERKGRLTVFVD